MIMADELGADWSKIKNSCKAEAEDNYVHQKYRRLFFSPDVLRNLCERQEQTARQIASFNAAAQKWEVDPSECYH